MLSARNQFDGTIQSMNIGQVMAEIVIAIGDVEVVSLISRDSARRMELKVGDTVTALIKSTEVMIEKG